MSNGTKSEGKRYDVVVIGGGAAGLSGALALVRSRRSVLVIDSGKPRNAPAAHMHNYLSRDGTSPLELLAIGRAEVTGYGGEVINATVTQIERSTNAEQRGFHVTLAGASTIFARRLLVATGAVDKLPDVPGLAERWGQDVIHCPYCHGWEVRDQAIGILATGPLATHSALMFSQLSADVILFKHTASLTDEHIEQLSARGITIVEGEVAAVEVEDDQLTGLRLRSGEFVPRQAVVVASQPAARADILDMLGLQPVNLEREGHELGTYIAADANGVTSEPGVWIAGNLADPMGQVIAAAAAGLKAGAMINFDLITEETERAVAAMHQQRTTPEPVAI